MRETGRGGELGTGGEGCISRGCGQGFLPVSVAIVYLSFLSSRPAKRRGGSTRPSCRLPRGRAGADVVSVIGYWSSASAWCDAHRPCRRERAAAKPARPVLAASATVCLALGFFAAATGTTTPASGSSVRGVVKVSTAPTSTAAASRAVRFGRFQRVSTVFRIDV